MGLGKATKEEFVELSKVLLNDKFVNSEKETLEMEKMIYYIPSKILNWIMVDNTNYKTHTHHQI